MHSRNVLFRLSDKPECYSDSKVSHRVAGVQVVESDSESSSEEAQDDNQEKRITLMPKAWKITWTANQPPEGTVPDYVVSPQTYYSSEVRGLDQIVLVDFSNGG
jgi:hypothetical protein